MMSKILRQEQISSWMRFQIVQGNITQEAVCLALYGDPTVRAFLSVCDQD